VYVDISHIHRGGKAYGRYLLRELFRDHGKVRHRTIANLSGCSAAEICAIRLALRHKDNLSVLNINRSEIVIKQGLSYGAVHVVHEVARFLGIVAALGTTRHGRLTLWQVIACVIDQGSRLSAGQLARAHASKEILDDLYANLDWLAEQQADIANFLFARQGHPKVSFSISPARISKANIMPSALSAITATANTESSRLSVTLQRQLRRCRLGAA
jgi:hypothetical protein